VCVCVCVLGIHLLSMAWWLGLAVSAVNLVPPVYHTEHVQQQGSDAARRAKRLVQSYFDQNRPYYPTARFPSPSSSMVSDEPLPCRANLHKCGLAQSPSCDCGQ